MNNRLNSLSNNKVHLKSGFFYKQKKSTLITDFYFSIVCLHFITIYYEFDNSYHTLSRKRNDGQAFRHVPEAISRLCHIKKRLCLKLCYQSVPKF